MNKKLVLKLCALTILSSMAMTSVSSVQASAASQSVPSTVVSVDSSNKNTQDAGSIKTLDVSEKDKLEIKQFLEKENKESKKQKNNTKIVAMAIPAVVAVYTIPGVGEVALLATGAIVIGGVAYYAGSWLYDKVMPYIIAFDIPNRLLKDGNTVDTTEFDQKIGGKTAWKEKKGWTIERDSAGGNSHGGSYWKLKKPSGERVATLDQSGKILRK